MIWKKHADMPVARSAPSAVRIGDYAYVGGGYTKPGSRGNIQRYNISKDEWTLLPKCPNNCHGLASLNKELVVIGGERSNVATNIVYTFRDGTWKQLLPPMPTPRSLPSTTSHEDQIIIAAGGLTHTTVKGEKIRTDVVEIYKRGEWYTTKRLPFLIDSMDMTIMDNTCYILGGCARYEKFLRFTIVSTLSSLLIENAVPEDPTYSTVHPVKWDTFPCKHPLLGTTITGVSGLLTTIGGCDKDCIGTKLISTYDFHSDSWVKCKGAELPLSLFRPGVMKLDDNRVMLFGGEVQSRRFSSQVFIGQFTV